MRNKFLSIVGLSILASNFSPLRAEQKRHLDDIVPGMSRHDVQQVWGEPDGKTEYESKRQEAWSYGEYRITFRQGKVLKALKTSPSYSAFYQAKEEKVAKPKRPSSANKDVAVEDILSEITQDADPESGDAPKAPKRRGR